MSTSKRYQARRGNNQAIAVIAIGAVFFAVVAGVYFLSRDDGDDGGSTPPVAEAALVTEDSWKITSEGAKVTIVEFLDFECEACRAAHPAVQEILQKYQGQITYVVRNFPNHNNSVLAIKAAEAAGEQGKYWEMYNILFERQLEWGEKQESQAEAFLSYAQELGLDMQAFQASLESDKYLDAIAAEKQAALDLGVEATPTFYINGTKLVGVQSVRNMSERIDNLLAQ